MSLDLRARRDFTPRHTPRHLTPGAIAKRERQRAEREAAKLEKFVSTRNTPERWQKALRRAHTQGFKLFQMTGGQILAISPAPRSIAYATDGVVCDCPIATYGDPVCPHRALVREHRGELVLDPEPAS